MTSEKRIFAIGDLQGCLDPLQRLLEKIQYDPANDQLWFAGDLVNRGPQSLQTLRFVKELSDAQPERVVSVLGNHDLHLLAIAHGVKKPRIAPTLKQILKADDRGELVRWLQHRPLLHRDSVAHTVMAHAGVYPGWRIAQAARYANEVESVLRSPRARKLLKKMYDRRPLVWEDALCGWDRHRFIIDACTRMRFLSRKGALNFTRTGPPGEQSNRWLPWYQFVPVRPRKNWRIVFGHWSAAGAWFDGTYIALDSGCVWGKKLTAARVDERRISLISVSCE